VERHAFARALSLCAISSRKSGSNYRDRTALPCSFFYLGPNRVAGLLQFDDMPLGMSTPSALPEELRIRLGKSVGPSPTRGHAGRGSCLSRSPCLRDHEPENDDSGARGQCFPGPARSHQRRAARHRGSQARHVDASISYPRSEAARILLTASSHRGTATAPSSAAAPTTP
jgi:hypothetical protein